MRLLVHACKGRLQELCGGLLASGSIWTLSFIWGLKQPAGCRAQVVVDIDGDGSFMMNCQELATAYIEKLDIKMMILNGKKKSFITISDS